MTLIQKASAYIEQLFKDKLSPSYLYHNYIHTKDLVNKVQIIGSNSGLENKDIELLVIAGWFHDSGYIKQEENHEEIGVDIATDFLKNEGCEESDIQKIASLIRATKAGYKPQNLMEKIIRDADCSHLGSSEYFTIIEKLRLEWELTQKKYYSDLEWNEGNEVFFTKSHQFYTDYAKENWEPIKEKNLKKIEKKIKKEKKSDKKEKSKKDKNDEKVLPKADRSIDTFFRVTLNNHTRLSDIADSKANILLSVNAIIISIALSTLIPKLDAPRNMHLIFPTFLLLFLSSITIIFAILSTKPKVTSGTFTKDDVKKRKVNLLFFGNFHKMPLEEYNPAVREMMDDRGYLYDSLIRDLYYLGVVLNRKYKLLSITYKIFMFEIIASVIAFVYAFSTM